MDGEQAGTVAKTDESVQLITGPCYHRGLSQIATGVRRAILTGPTVHMFTVTLTLICHGFVLTTSAAL